MAIINVTEDTAKAAALTISRRIERLYATIARELDISANLVWNNPNVTPSQIFNELGTEGSKLFSLSSALVNLANTANPGQPITLNIPYEYTINEDGSVTAGNLIVQSSSSSSGE